MYTPCARQLHRQFLRIAGFEMSTTHQYKPLDQEATEIRLLHLLELVDGAEHGYEEQCIRGRFEYTSIQGKGDMEEKTPYRALSYVWGAPNLTSAIILDDDSQIRVSHNLLIAIKHVFWHRYAPVRQTHHIRRCSFSFVLTFVESTLCRSGSMPCALTKATMKKRAGR